jgi:hypothetical protein
VDELFSDLKKLLTSWNPIGGSVLTEYLRLRQVVLELSAQSRYL